MLFCRYPNQPDPGGKLRYATRSLFRHWLSPSSIVFAGKSNSSSLGSGVGRLPLVIYSGGPNSFWEGASIRESSLTFGT